MYSIITSIRAQLLNTLIIRSLFASDKLLKDFT